MHEFTFRSDDYKLTIMLEDPRGDEELLERWAGLVQAAVTIVQTGQIVVGEPVPQPPERWKTLRFRPERHGETEVRTTAEARTLSRMFDGISVQKGDRLTWGLGTEGECS